MSTESLRYGKFRFGDYLSAWIGILFLFIIGIGGFYVDSWFILNLYALSLAFFMLLSIIIPNTEKFTILDNTIVIRQGGKRRETTIPEEPTLIISYADVCPPLAKRVSIGNQTYILKDKYAVSILQKMPLERILECLHRNRIQKYTNSTIEEDFYDRYYVYSFVCNQSMLKKLITNREPLLIIPESLLECVSVDPEIVNTYIDAGY